MSKKPLIHRKVERGAAINTSETYKEEMPTRVEDLKNPKLEGNDRITVQVSDPDAANILKAFKEVAPGVLGKLYGTIVANAILAAYKDLDNETKEKMDEYIELQKKLMQLKNS